MCQTRTDRLSGKNFSSEMKMLSLVWYSPGSAARCRAAVHRGWNEGYQWPTGVEFFTTIKHLVNWKAYTIYIFIHVLCCEV